MQELKKIAGINLLVLLISMTLIKISDNSGQSESFAFLIFSAMIIAALSILNVIISIYYFSTSKPKTGQAYLLSALLVLIIGGSLCFGGAAL